MEWLLVATFKPLRSGLKDEPKDSSNFKPLIFSIKRETYFNEHSYSTKRVGNKMELKNGK